jgi:hypothetical protein
LTVALKKADGDLFVDPETGRGEVVSGPTKVDQEMFSLYTTDFDPARNWGSKLNLKYYTTASSLEDVRADIYSELVTANNRLLSKQENDPYLDPNTEAIKVFDRADVLVDTTSQLIVFITSAQVGDPSTTVGQQLFLSYKPISTRQVLPPPFPAGLLFKF